MSDESGACGVCQEPAKLRCASCHSVFYCKKEHQREDWNKHKKDCRSYEVKFSAVRKHRPVVFSGTGLVLGPETPALDTPYVVATRDIKKDQVIVDETPAVIGPNYITDYPEQVCPGCHRLDPLKFCCPRCEWPVCSRMCPGLGEPTRHGAECAALNKLKSFVIPRRSFVLLPLRCLLLQKTDPKKWKIFQEVGTSAALISTSSGSTESKLFLREFVLKRLAKAAPDMIPDCSDETVRKVFAVLDVYGLSIHAPQFGHLTAVCGVSSLMEHSCVPNARRFVDIPPVLASQSTGAGAQLRCRVVMRATQDIPKGAKISTLYMDTWMSTWARQVSLFSRRKFQCECVRCLDPRELGTDFGTLKCTSAGCGGWVLPMSTPSAIIGRCDWKCEKCRKIYPDADVMARLLRVKDEMDGYRVGRDQSVHRYEALLKHLLTLFHPNHHYCLLIKERLARMHGEPLLGKFGGGSRMTDAQLKRTAELCGDVARMMTNPAIVSENLGKVAECLTLLAMANIEIAKRERASGKLSAERASSVLLQCEEMIRRAMRLTHSQFDTSSAYERMPVELLENIAVTLLSAPARGCD